MDCGPPDSASNWLNSCSREGNRILYYPENLHQEASTVGVDVSLATVYNTLHQFTAAGLLRVLAIDGNKTYFDTNTSSHFHFYLEESNAIFDIDGSSIEMRHVPAPPRRFRNQSYRHCRAASIDRKIVECRMMYNFALVSRQQMLVITGI